MSIAAETVKVVRLKQGAASLAKDLFVNIGWKPDMIEVYNLGVRASNGTWTGGGAIGVWVDELSEEGDIGLGAIGGATSFDPDATLGITPHSKGFYIGQNSTLVKVNNGRIVLRCTRNMYDFGVVDVDSDLPKYSDNAYGKGTQYKIDTANNTYDPSLSDGGVYQKA